ncbi:LRR receptor-like serine/threonine-protein kinase GSO2 [Salvia hispanica]|uniref:LRR receptor-like serine/threonine-protein kinase GSO2 n=1 Tax=Salvia hispanica TaxID=49212 RepID=UPI002008FE58|nr:LRR receptor-like serine/threonine-protein kinase GSO2 [Salvia hispanica]XP_047975987.1 LRR receptor-like serine/threonine-protein kinase GSO2 [Salvia hispanica]
MRRRVSCNALYLFVIMLCIEMMSSQLPPDQVSAMTTIYEIIQNNSSASSFLWSNVLNSSNPCSWKGVGCNSVNSSIISVSVKSSSISTSDFLPFVCNVATLESLDVSNNQISSIPDGFFTGCGGITGLKLLNFSVNRLSGPLPTFNGFPMLDTLDLSRNMLSGEVSMQLDGLGSLKTLNLGWNNFGGKIPTNLGNMNLLEEIHLSLNNFTGEIPLAITKYKNLSVIDLSGNSLSGSIPIEFGGFTRLETLILSLNNLSGGIPTFLANITSLERFAANQNSFTGSIPSGITKFLSFLDLSYNNLSGAVPSDLLSGPNLQVVDLSFNKLEGSIPAITSTKLYRLRLGSNSLNGTIPSASLRSLMYLELDNNMLSGEIPSDLGIMFSNLSLLNLASNRFGGALPPSLGSLTSLYVLSLQSNSFSGGIPPQILSLSKLEKLNLSCNTLNGSIPLSISRMQNLRNLDLHANNLSGSIPDSIGEIPYLVELQLGNNQLSGRIPQMPDTLQISLNLSHNLFGGPIPVTLSRLQNLEVLDLSDNRFSGVIPDFLTQLSSLTHLLVMNNDLSGIVPKFGRNLVFDFEGNELVSPSPPPPPTAKKSKSIALIIIIAASSATAAGLWVVMVVYISRRYSSFHVNLLSTNSSNIDFKKAFEAVADPQNITLKTRFSTYYKALLPSGAAYFIKKVNRLDKMFSLHSEKRLGQELHDLGNLSDPNLMIPFAYLSTLRGLYLFYDFTPQGTLFDSLHRAAGSALGWRERYAIALGVSQGLSSLHQSQILLLDLSSKSIALKSSNEPQIGDIELFRLISPSQSTGSLSTVAGSAGYVPPEYAYSMRVTEAGNVYSFGVVLLELLSGKQAVSEGTELAKWVVSISDWDQILDSNVGEIETSIAVKNQMLGVVEVALACINISPEMRPNAVSVVQMLLNSRQIDIEIT